MKIANDLSNSELEESIRELGTNNTTNFPATLLNDDSSEEEAAASFLDEDEEENDTTDIVPITSPVANLLSKYYSPKELQSIQRSISPEKAAALHQSMLNISTGAYSSIPRICHGKTCKSSHACPFVKQHVETQFIGNKCPIEIMLIDEWRGQYMDLIKQNNIDQDNIVVHNYINELIECDIVTMRMNHYIALEGEVVDTVFVINPKTGDPETTPAQNVAFMIKAFVSTRKEKAMQALIATPYWKAKMASKDDNKQSEASKAAEILKRAKEVQKQRHSEETIQDVSYSVVSDGDEPIY